MLYSLKYNLEFTNGKKLNTQQTLCSGLTLITGANESGKSMFMEMILFALWGSECLRGPRSDYKNIDVVLETSLFTVTRSLTSAKVEVEGIVKSSGQTGATKEIAKLLGFGCQTFLTTCAIRQGEVEALGKMRPAARKSMVEDALGINALNACEKFAKSQISQIKTNLLSLQNLLQPVLIVEAIAEGLKESVEVKLSELIKVKNAHDQATHTIRHLTKTVEDFSGFPVAVEGDVNAVKLEVEDLLQSSQRVRTLKHTLTFMLAPSLPYTLSETQEKIDIWDQITHWKTAPIHPNSVKRRLKEKEWYELSQQCASNIKCPSCGVEFTSAGEVQTAILAQLEALQDYRCTKLTDEHRYADLAVSEAFWGDLEDPPLLVSPPHSRNELEAHLASLVNSIERTKLTDELEQLEGSVELLAQKQQVLKDLMDCQQRFDIAEAKYLSVQRAETQIAELKTDLCDYDIDGKVSALSRQLGEIEDQLRQLEKQQLAIERNTKIEQEIKTHEDNKEQYVLSLEAIHKVRNNIKTTLAPELSTRASTYMSQLTGMSRVVVVDGDMDVVVDGVGLHALSGSAKACADLSLRFALAGAMTQKVFPVLLCDEPDASFDDARAEKIVQLLQTLSQSGQVIMISHKDTHADRKISL